MITPVTTVIDGDTYEFMPMAATEARKWLMILQQTFGPSVAEAFSGIKDAAIPDGALELDTGDPKMIVAMLGPIAGSISGLVRGFSSSLNAAGYEALVEAFLSRTWVETDSGGKLELKKGYRELNFYNKLALEARILLWCLKEQYSDFFGYLETARVWLEAAKGTAASLLKSPSQSTGGSSESQHRAASTLASSKFNVNGPLPT